MAKVMVCTKCGYSCADKDMFCPICGGRMASKSVEQICDPVKEREWNSSYHNDFEENTKTGEYCDREFEKSVNGGEHYHDHQKSGNQTSPAAFFNEPEKARLILIIIQAALCFAPLVGIFFFGTCVDKMRKGEMPEEYKKPLVIAMVVAYVAKYSFWLMKFIGNNFV